MNNQISIVPLCLNSLWGYGYAMAFKQISPRNGAIFGATSHVVQRIAGWVFKKLNFDDTSTALLTCAVTCLSGYGLLTKILSETITPGGVIKTYLGMEGSKILALFLYCFLKSVLTVEKEAHDMRSAAKAAIKIAHGQGNIEDYLK